MTPTEAMHAGLCAGCIGSGRVDRCVPYEDIFPCSTCGGDGKWPPLDWRCRRLIGHIVRPMGSGNIVALVCQKESGHEGICI